MSFTDDELLTLKKLIDDPEASGFFTEDMARRLIGRLEAAEICAKHMQDMEPKCRFLLDWYRSKGELNKPSAEEGAPK